MGRGAYEVAEPEPSGKRKRVLVAVLGLPWRRMDVAGGWDAALRTVTTEVGAGVGRVTAAAFGLRPSAAWTSFRVSFSAKMLPSSSISRISRSLPRTVRERRESMPTSLKERVPVSSSTGMPTSSAMVRRMVARIFDSSPETSSVSMSE